MKIKNKNKIILTLLVFGAMFLTANCVFAQPVSPADYNHTNDVALTKVTDGSVDSGPVLLNFLLTVSSGILAMLAAVLNFSINIGKSVISLPIVQTGSNVMISFANLGFVFAIIVMAFATIFRVQSYAMKQTLWKLIVAALLVNFSLTIAGAFISVSNIFTDFFLQGLNGKSISDGLMGILNPQGLVQVKDASLWKIATGLFSYIFQYMASLLFAIVFIFIIILTFFALTIMLLIRAVTLGILLIIMPIVWLLWIFPGTSKYWSEWWSNFLRWTFFAPIVLFFIVLVISSGNQLNGISNIGQQENAAIQKAFSDSMILNKGFFDHVLQIIITTGLLLGGLFAANKMGITFASTAMGWAQGTGKAFGGWAGRKGIRLGTLPARSAIGQRAIEGMQKIGAEGGFLARNTLGRLGNRLGSVGVQQGEKLTSQAEARQKNLSDKQLALRVSTMTNDERVAALSRLTKNKNLDMVPDAAKYIKDPKMKKIFASYGKGKEYGDMEKTMGFNTAMLTGKDEDGKAISIQAATKKFRMSHSIKDYDKLQGNILGKKASYGLTDTEHENIRSEVVKSIFDAHPGAISKARSSLKGEDVVNFQDEVDNYIDTFEKANIRDEEVRKKGVKEKLEYIDKNLNPSFRNWARGLYGSRKNFGGSLFGSGYSGTSEEHEAEKQ
ncbi:MAG: hypothetical protein WC461_01155 [Candidatus Paceibacterota bacterium]